MRNQKDKQEEHYKSLLTEEDRINIEYIMWHRRCDRSMAQEIYELEGKSLNIRKEGKERMNRLNNNFRFSNGKFKGSLIRKIITTPEGLNYCMWLCKKIETDYNDHPFFSKREVRNDRKYFALKYHLRKIGKYKKYLKREIYSGKNRSNKNA